MFRARFCEFFLLDQLCHGAVVEFLCDLLYNSYKWRAKHTTVTRMPLFIELRSNYFKTFEHMAQFLQFVSPISPPPLRNYHHHFHDLLHFIYTFKTELPTGWLTAVMRTGWSLEDLSCATLNIGDSKNAVRKLLLIIYFEIELSNYLTALIDVIFAFWQEIWNCMFNLILYLILRFYIITFEKKEMFWK